MAANPDSGLPGNKREQSLTLNSFDNQHPSRTICMRNFDRLQRTTGDFGRYQLYVFLSTQLSYIPVTGTMLCTIFDTLLPKENMIDCDSGDYIGDNVTSIESLTGFKSLLLDMGLICRLGYLKTSFSTSLMMGGIVGASLAGFLADRYGRKWICIGSLALVGLFNAIFATCGLFAPWLSIAFMFLLGSAGGGYLVVNLVVLLEVVGTQHYRLGATSFNGWPLGMCVMSAIGYLTAHWRYYHFCLAVTAFCGCFAMLLTLDETARWLIQQNRIEEAEVIMRRIARKNGRRFPEGMSLLDIVTGSASVRDGDQRDLFNEQSESVHSESTTKKYNYFDLLNYTQIMIYLGALTYSWHGSAIISFGIYFNLNHLYGNAFMKTFLTGLAKGVTGVIPFVIGRWVGRKPILLVSVVIAAGSVWAVVITYFLFGPDSWLMTAFTIMGAAAIDPIWKVNHLYSTELFPTVVRNMARAVCNVGSRTGSFIGPQVAFLAPAIHDTAPYFVFGVLAIVQVVICWLYLPETKGKQLPDRLPNLTQRKGSQEMVKSELC